MKIIAIGAAIVFAALLISFIPMYHAHNVSARALLSELTAIKLPPGTAVQYQGWDVGDYEGASTICEDLAYVVLTSNEPKSQVIAYYESTFQGGHVSGGTNGFIRNEESDYHVARLDALPSSTPYPITNLADQIPADEKNKTYVLWAQGWPQANSFWEDSWDIRAW